MTRPALTAFTTSPPHAAPAGRALGNGRQPAAGELAGQGGVLGAEAAASSSSRSATARAATARSRWRSRWSEATRRRGRPLWTRPRTLPSRRSSQSRSASSKPSRISCDRREARLRHLVGGVGDEDAVRLHGSSTDAPAELVELGQPEAIGALDDHHRRLRDVDPDLDHGRADEHVQLAVAESRHLGVAIRGLHPAMDEADPQRREDLGEADVLRLGRDRLVREVILGRAIADGGVILGVLPLRRRRPPGLPAARRSAARRRRFDGPRPPAPARRTTSDRARRAGGSPSGSGTRPSGGVRRSVTSRSAYSTWPSVRGIGVAVISRTCGRAAARLRLERAALLHAEPVLLVDDDEAQVGERRRAPGTGHASRRRSARRRPRAAPSVAASAAAAATRSAARPGSRRRPAGRVSVRWCCRASRSVGASSAPCSPASAAAASA